MTGLKTRLVAEESGIALIVTVLLLLLVSALGISALNRAGDEKIVASASRRQLANLAAAEAGLAIIAADLQSQAADGAVPAAMKLDRPTLFLDPYTRMPTSVRSGGISDKLPVEVTWLGRGGTDDGFELREGGAQASGKRLVYRVDVTSTDPTQGHSQVQAQFSVLVRQSLQY
jgi:hypothetical protein